MAGGRSGFLSLILALALVAPAQSGAQTPLGAPAPAAGITLPLQLPQSGVAAAGGRNEPIPTQIAAWRHFAIERGWDIQRTGYLGTIWPEFRQIRHSLPAHAAGLRQCSCSRALDDRGHSLKKGAATFFSGLSWLGMTDFRSADTTNLDIC